MAKNARPDIEPMTMADRPRGGWGMSLLGQQRFRYGLTLCRDERSDKTDTERNCDGGRCESRYVKERHGSRPICEIRHRRSYWERTPLF